MPLEGSNGGVAPFEILGFVCQRTLMENLKIIVNKIHLKNERMFVKNNVSYYFDDICQSDKQCW